MWKAMDYLMKLVIEWMMKELRGYKGWERYLYCIGVVILSVIGVKDHRGVINVRRSSPLFVLTAGECGSDRDIEC